MCVLTPPPRLYPATHSGDLAAQILQLLPSQRMKASDALHHGYFAVLPPSVHSIADGESELTIMYSVYMYMLYVHNYPAHLCTRVMWCVCAQAMNFCSRSSSLLQKHLYSLFLVCPSLEDETCNTSVHFTSSLYTPLQLWLSLLPSTSLLPSLLINLTFLYSSFKCVCELVCQYYYTWC